MDAKYAGIVICVLGFLALVLIATPSELVYSCENATLTLSSDDTYLVEPADPLYAFSGNYNEYAGKVALEIPFGHLILIHDGGDLVDEDGDVWVRQ